MLVRGASITALLCVGLGVAAWRVASHEPVLLAGSFHSVAHKGSGRALITSGQLRLMRVKTYPASDLEVCLIAAPDAEDNETVARSSPVCLGPFGRNAFPIPAGLDLNRYRAVVVWSASYGVNFTTAPLSK